VKFVARFAIKSIKNEQLWRKFLLAFVLMSLIPLLLMVYIVFFILKPATEMTEAQVRWLIFWIACSVLVGLFISRKMFQTFISITKTIKSVANGNLSVKVEPSDEVEINELAKSFNRITKRLEENIKELERSKQTLQDVLSRVGQAVASFQNIDRFLDLIVATTLEAVGAENGRLLLLDEEKEELFTKISIGPEKRPKEKIRIGQGIIGTVAREKKRYMITASQTEDACSMVCLPLIYSNKIIGVLEIINKQRDFSQDNLVLLNDLASQMAVSIENWRLNENAEKTYVETLNALALVVDARDPYTRGHSKRVGDYCVKVAKAFGLDDSTIKLLRDASNIHDIGKIGIPDEILLKPAVLNEEETRIIHEHPVIGENILRPIRSLAALCDLVRHHHERVNGKGYPDGLRAEDISLPLNIMIVADAYDAMTTDRPYRRGLPKEEAKRELVRCSEPGGEYNREVVDKFIATV
jgi:HD-GYP domain-containing protein (c-di-GMP phosphodiesterase class II)